MTELSLLYLHQMCVIFCVWLCCDDQRSTRSLRATWRCCVRTWVETGSRWLVNWGWLTSTWTPSSTTTSATAWQRRCTRRWSAGRWRRVCWASPWGNCAVRWRAASSPSSSCSCCWSLKTPPECLETPPCACVIIPLVSSSLEGIRLGKGAFIQL